MRLTQNQQAMLDAWQRHTHAEFVLKDVDAALATMTSNPYVLAIPTGRGGMGRAGVRAFYADEFLPHIPPDFELSSVSQIIGGDRIVEEFVVRFTHTLEIPWMLPDVPPTGRSAEFMLVGVIGFQGGKLAHEHIHWDQLSVLSQLGALDQSVAAAGIGSAAKVRKLSGTADASRPARTPRPSPAFVAGDPGLGGR